MKTIKTRKTVKTAVMKEVSYDKILSKMLTVAIVIIVTIITIKH